MYGKIVVIKRNGADGAHFPLINTSCCFGRNNECDIRIQLPDVSREHCKLDVNLEGQVFVTNVSSINPTRVNKKELAGPRLLEHGDIITIVDRSFRFEFMPDSKYFRSSETSSTEVLCPQGLAGSKSSFQPLSSRSENVLTTASSVVSPKKATLDGIAQTSSTQKSGTNNPLDDLLDGLSPASFYKATTPKRLRGGKTASNDLVNAGPSVQDKKTPSPKSRQNPSAGSPYVASARRQRKSISSHHKSRPQFEENLSPLKRKRVSFGPQLSPEQFDKSLPPKTPVKRGAAPRRSFPLALNTPHSVLKRRSATTIIKEESSPDIFSHQGTNTNGESLTKPRSLARSRSSSPRSPRSSEAFPSLFYPRGGASVVKKVGTTSLPGYKTQEPTDHSFADCVVTLPLGKPHDQLQTDENIARRPSRSPRRHSTSETSFCGTSTAEEHGSIHYSPKTPRASARTPSAPGRTSHLSTFQKHTQGGVYESTPDNSLTHSATRNSLCVQMQTNIEKSSKSFVARTYGLQQIPLETGEMGGYQTRSAEKTPRSYCKDLILPNICSDNPVMPQSEKNITSRTSPAQTLPETETLRKRNESPKVTSATQTPASTQSTLADVLPISSGLRVLRSRSASPVSGKTFAKNMPFRSSVLPFEQSNAVPEIPSRTFGQSSPRLSPDNGLTKAQNKSPSQTPTAASPVADLQIPGAAKRKSFSSTEFSLTSEDAGESSLTEIYSFADASTDHGVLSDTCDTAPGQPVGNSKTPKGLLLSTASAANTCKSVSPVGMTRIFRTPKRGGLKRNSITPTVLRQIMKTPRSKKTESPSLTGVKRLMKTPNGLTSASPRGIARLMKTPKFMECGAITSPSPSGIKRIFCTPAVSKPTISTTLNPVGVKRIMKTPRGPAREQASPTGIRRIMKTSRRPANKQASPTGVKRLMKTPRGPANKQVSPVGVSRLLRTPKVAKSATPSPSGIQRLFQSPTGTPELTGIKRLMKTPQQTAAVCVSPVGFPGITETLQVDNPEMSAAPTSRRTSLLQKPEISAGGAIATSSPTGIKKMLNTPKQPNLSVVSAPSPAGLAPLKKTPHATRFATVASPSPGKKVRTPVSASEKVRKSLNSSRVKRLTKMPRSIKKGIIDMSGIAELFKTPSKSDNLSKVSASAGSRNEITDTVQTAQADVIALVEKMIAVPADFNKMAALKTWSEVVKSGVPAGTLWNHTSGPLMKMGKKIIKKKTSRPVATLGIRKTGKTPKTPRTLARIQASSTGHVDSPETLVVGRMVSKGRPRTPRDSYKGEKVQQPKAETAVEMNVSLTGVKELFESPAAHTTVEEELYADIPDTPGGPGEMIVSPLSDQRGGQQIPARKNGRRSTVLVGVRNLFHFKRASKEPRVSGIRRLVATPRSKKKASPALSGVARLMRTPRVRAPAVESPSSFQRIFATPKTRASSLGRGRKNSAAEPDNSGEILELKHLQIYSQSNARSHRPEVTGEVDVAANPGLYTSVQTPTEQHQEPSKLRAATTAQLPDDSALIVEEAVAEMVRKGYRCGRRGGLPVNFLSPSLRKSSRISAFRDRVKAAEATSSKDVPSVAMKAAFEDEKEVTSFKSLLPSRASKVGEHKSRTIPFHDVCAEPVGVAEEDTALTFGFVGNGSAAPDISTLAITKKNKYGDMLSTVAKSPAKVVSTPVRRTGRRVTLVTPAKINYITPAPLKRRGRSRVVQMPCIEEPSASPVLSNRPSSVAVRRTRSAGRTLPGKVWDLADVQTTAGVSAILPATPKHAANKIQKSGNTPAHPDSAMTASPSLNPVKLGRGGKQLPDNIVKSGSGKKGARAKSCATLVEIDMAIATKTRRGRGTKIGTETAKVATTPRAEKDRRCKSAAVGETLKASTKQQADADLDNAELLQSEGLSSRAKNDKVENSTAATETVGEPLLQTKSTRASKTTFTPIATRLRGTRQSQTKQSCMESHVPSATRSRRDKKDQMTNASGLQSESKLALDPHPAAAHKRTRRDEKGQGDVLDHASHQKATQSKVVAKTKIKQPTESAHSLTRTKRSATKREGGPAAKKAASAKPDVLSDEDSSPVTLRRLRVAKNKLVSPIKPGGKKSKRKGSGESASSMQKGKRKKASSSLDLSFQDAVKCSKKTSKTADKSNRKEMSAVRCLTRSKTTSAADPSAAAAKERVKK